MKLKKLFLLGLLFAVIAGCTGCGADQTAGSDSRQEEEKEDEDDRDEEPEDDPSEADESEEEPPLSGSYWVSDDFGTGEGFEAELFLFNDGTFFYREPRIFESGIEGYDVLNGTELTWTEDGEKITLRQKWGWADEDSEEDVDHYELIHKDGVITFDDLRGDRGRFTLSRAEMPVLPSKADAYKMVGSWKLIASEIEGWMDVHYSENDYLDERIEITEKDESYYASYTETNGGDLYEEWDDIAMTLTDDPIYDGFKNCFWSADLDSVPTDDNWRLITLYDDNILTLVESNYGVHENEDYIFISYRYFVRDDDEADVHTREFFCPRKVTVSDVHELASAIMPGTEITLEGGTYDFSMLASDEETNWFFHDDYIDNFNWTILADRISLKPADGEKVRVVIGNPYAPVLDFTNSSNIWITDLTCGHNEDVGPCGAPVIRFNDGNHLNVSGCSLYGCGSYGIMADGGRTIDFKNTEIYGCSQGAAYFSGSSEALFDKCFIHDNEISASGLFYCYGSSSLYVRDSKIMKNTGEDESLICSYEYSDALFKNCRFLSNAYDLLSESDREDGVLFEGCSW